MQALSGPLVLGMFYPWTIGKVYDKWFGVGAGVKSSKRYIAQLGICVCAAVDGVITPVAVDTEAAPSPSDAVARAKPAICYFRIDLRNSGGSE